ncbi:MAG: AmmeMemoRadiSam system protein B [Ignavibacteriales bacterium]|nr:AmmeMemoRadiSam system protein B [Ignavibacteriales bacterium]
MSAAREAAVAGLFYPELKSVLEKEVDEYLLRAKVVRIDGTIRGLICPHAGYMYSGMTAAAGYRLLKGRTYDAVIVVGPSHREYFEGATIHPGTSYKTPLGEVPIHEELREMLAKSHSGIRLSEHGHTMEHSVEVQLPFLQRALGRTPFVPLVMGDQRRESCVALAKALADACRNRNVLLVASSDLSHYHPYGEAVDLDKRVVADVEAFRPEDLLRKLELEEVEACGGGPMVSVMLASRSLGAECCKSLFYCNSGDVTGEKDAVVGYLSAALFQDS